MNGYGWSRVLILRKAAALAKKLAALMPGLGATPVHAGDPTLVWHTIDSEHFAIHFPEPLGTLARKVALAAERAHATLSVALRHAPRERTQIVLTDHTDGANGFASVLPRNDIRLFASAPSDVSDLNDHDDWQ